MSSLFTFSRVFNPGRDDHEARPVAIPIREVAEMRTAPYGGTPYSTEVIRRYPCGRTVRIPCDERIEVLVQRYNFLLGLSSEAKPIVAGPTRA